MNILKTKKGAGFKILNYSFLRILFIALLFYIVYLFAYSQIKVNIDTDDTKALIFVKRILYSPNSISYVEPITGRAYPGIVDPENFKPDALDSAFNITTTGIAAKIELTNLEDGNQKEIYLNKKWYDRWEPLAKFSRYEKIIKKRYVLINDEGELKKGLLRIDVVLANG
jgi:hypothetical protein